MIPVPRWESHGDHARGASVTTEHQSKNARRVRKDEPGAVGLVCVDSLRDAVSGVLLGFGGDAGDGNLPRTLDATE